MVPLKHACPASFLSDEMRPIVVPSKKKSVWAVELDLLEELDRVCRQHGIRYFVDSGTLLGAVRHKGFIPWDDDVDVLMDRSEYEKFLLVASKDFAHPYFLQTDVNSAEAARGHAQLRNSETAGILAGEMEEDKCVFHFNQGIFIDIFPLDHVPDDQQERFEFMTGLFSIKKRIWLYRRAIQAFRAPRVSLFSPAHFLLFLFGGGLLFLKKIFRVDLLQKNALLLDAKAKKYQSEQTRESTLLMLLPDFNRAVFRLNQDFQAQKFLPFEYLQVPVPQNYERVLTREYGDWRQQIICASAHGEVLFDVDRSYREYLQRTKWAAD